VVVVIRSGGAGRQRKMRSMRRSMAGKERSERRPTAGVSVRRGQIGGRGKRDGNGLEAAQNLDIYTTAVSLHSLSDLGLRSDIWAGWSGVGTVRRRSIQYTWAGPFHFLYFFFDAKYKAHVDYFGIQHTILTMIFTYCMPTKLL
jgi:hypothetical protein